jgi:hypothetical protein
MFKKMLDLIGSTPFTSEDLKDAGILFYKKLKAAVFYKPAGKYQGPVTLFKAKDSFVSLNTDYGLSQVSNDYSLIAIALNGSHAIINRWQSCKTH